LYFAQDPDGSKAALEEVQLGMTPSQVDEVLARSAYKAKRGPTRLGVGGSFGPPPSPAPVFHFVVYSYREHDLAIYFDKTGTVISKDRTANGQKAPWWEVVFSFWNRVRAVLGV